MNKKRHTGPYHVKVMVIRVTDGQVSSIQIHLPRHLLWTVLFHLSTTINSILRYVTLRYVMLRQEFEFLTRPK